MDFELPEELVERVIWVEIGHPGKIRDFFGFVRHADIDHRCAVLRDDTSEIGQRRNCGLRDGDHGRLRACLHRGRAGGDRR